MNDKPPVIFLLGPTASGKTDLAITLADQLPVELISVDSTQVYRGLDIGAAKPGPEQLAKYPHRLIDIRDPADPYSAADFRRDALVAVADIHRQGRIPLLVGGTMLYFNVLLKGLADLPAADSAVRAKIEREAAQQGWPALHARLAGIDPDTAARLHPNHSQRIARALEVYQVSGRTMTELQRDQQGNTDSFRDNYQLLQLALVPEHRTGLHRRIEQRFQQMLAAGFEAEVRGLYQRGDLSPDLPAIRAVGYRQMWGLMEGDYDYREMVARGLAATRQLAKRQLTWLRRWPDLYPLTPDDRQGGMRHTTQIGEQALEYLRGRGI